MAIRSAKMGKITQLEAIGFVWELFIAIALPTTLFALGGRWGDARLGTGPWLTIVGLFVSLAIAGSIVNRKAKRIAARMKTPPNPS